MRLREFRTIFPQRSPRWYLRTVNHRRTAGGLGVAIVLAVSAFAGSASAAVTLPSGFQQTTANTYADHGFLGVAVDAQYATNHYVYLLYTYENNESDYEG